jgi:Tfp pilus assembly protein PilN
MVVPLINLLPWRETRLSRRRRLVLVSLGAAVILALVTVACVYSLIASATTRREHDNTRQSEAIAAFKQRAGEAQALADTMWQQQTAFVRSRQLHAARLSQVQTLSTLPLSTSPGLVPGELNFEPSAIRIRGSAASAAHVSRWLRALEARADVVSVELQALYLRSRRETGTGQDYFFSVRIGLGAPDTTYLAAGDTP